MFDFRTFARAGDPSRARYLSDVADLVAADAERLSFEAVLHTGPFRGQTLSLTYDGDFAVDGDAVAGSITRLTVAIDGRPLFEIAPEARSTSTTSRASSTTSPTFSTGSATRRTTRATKKRTTTTRDDDGRGGRGRRGRG